MEKYTQSESETRYFFALKIAKFWFRKLDEISEKFGKDSLEKF